MTLTPAEKLAKEKKKRPQPKRAERQIPPFNCILKQLRTSVGLSLRDVEKATGVNNVTLWKLEYGYDACLTTAMKLAAFYGMRVDDIWSPK